VLCLSNYGHWKKYVLKFQILPKVVKHMDEALQKVNVVRQWNLEIQKWAKPCHFESRKKQCLEAMFFIKYFGGCVEV
jgi:hypothetical protein